MPAPSEPDLPRPEQDPAATRLLAALADRERAYRKNAVTATSPARREHWETQADGVADALLTVQDVLAHPLDDDDWTWREEAARRIVLLRLTPAPGRYSHGLEHAYRLLRYHGDRPLIPFRHGPERK